MKPLRLRHVFPPFAPILILWALAAADPAGAELKGKYHLALIRVTYADTTPRYTTAQLKLAAAEIESFYDNLSNGNLKLEVSFVDVRTTRAKAFYWSPSGLPCDPALEIIGLCTPPTLFEDAAQLAAAGGFKFDTVDGISILSTFCAGDVTFGPLAVSRPGVKGTFERAYDFECAPRFADTKPTPGPSGVWWGPWSHELGHQLEIFDHVELGGIWNGHPSGYASGYDLMDSCYPCSESAYSLMSTDLMTGTRRVFNGWLADDKVSVLDFPISGTVSTTTKLRALSLSRPSVSTKFTNVLKLPVTDKFYYLVEARRRRLADGLWYAPGIWDEGIHVLLIDETADPSVKPINSCDTTVAGGCAYPGGGDPRLPDCKESYVDGLPRSAADVPGYCWPFPLFHPGDTFQDLLKGVKVHVDSAFADGFQVTVTRGTTVFHPDATIPRIDLSRFEVLKVVPGSAPKFHMWIDSSCNGYESDVGSVGLRFPRPSEGAQIKTKILDFGDAPCANHENRLYARVRNEGKAPAIGVRVRFSVADPEQIGTGPCSEDANHNPPANCGGNPFVPVGTVDSQTFPALAAVPPGQTVEVFFPWTPQVQLSPGQIAEGGINLRVAVRAEIDPVPDELSTGNNAGELRLDRIEAISDRPNRLLSLPGRTVRLTNPDAAPRAFFLTSEAILARRLSYSIAGGRQSQSLAAGETRDLPVVFSLSDENGPDADPDDVLATGDTYTANTDIRTAVPLENPLVPHDVDNSHPDIRIIGNTPFLLHVVAPSSLSLDAAIDFNGRVPSIVASGRLSPRHANVFVAIDYTDTAGQTVTRLARTDRAGAFSDRLPGAGPGFSVRAIWQGDLDHASAISPEVRF